MELRLSPERYSEVFLVISPFETRMYTPEEVNSAALVSPFFREVRTVLKSAGKLLLSLSIMVAVCSCSSVCFELVL